MSALAMTADVDCSCDAWLGVAATVAVATHINVVSSTGMALPAE